MNEELKIAVVEFLLVWQLVRLSKSPINFSSNYADEI